MKELRIGEKVYEPWVESMIVCVEDGKGCSDCIFSEDGSSCPTRVAEQYPCYHSDREDGKDVHYKKC